ncbi:hypothetical protein CBS147332_8835 [Penicillium roqueforti]|nr:hypothetical protein CBS147332_8835 [Penicillium roqueforti]KAI3103890.1 hypothetical protein CBS147331_7494 [Penicillium roqueforti]
MEKGKKGRRPFPVLRPPSSLLKPAYPTTLPAQTAPPHADQPYDHISTTHGTIAARAVSFHGQLLSGVTPLQLAQNGLYYSYQTPTNPATSTAYSTATVATSRLSSPSPIGTGCYCSTSTPKNDLRLCHPTCSHIFSATDT